MPRRKQPPAKPTTYERPYWFDRARSLAELHGWPRADPGDGRGLVGRYQTATSRPIGQLDADALVTLFTQQTDPHYLVPVALDLLRGHPDERLLSCVMRCSATFWSTHPHLRGELTALLAGLVAPAEDLAREAAAFIAGHPRAR